MMEFCMTTTIKAIVCPRCGSTEHETLEAGRQYRCSSCGTEFFLDSDRKEVLVQHKVIREEEKKASSRGCLFITALFLLLVAVIFAAVSRSCREQPVQRRASVSASGATPKAPAVHYDVESLVLVADPAHGNAPIALRIRGSSGKNGTPGYFADSCDLRTKQWSEAALLQDRIGTGAREARFQRLSDGQLFLVLDKSRLFRFDFSSRAWEDARPLLDQQKELAGSVVQIETGYPSEGDALRVVTADGVRRYFYPGVNMAPTYQELGKLVTEYRHPGAEEGYGFTFARKRVGSTGPQQLIRYHYLDNRTGPRMFSGYLEWEGDGAERHIVEQPYLLRQARIDALEFFTPARQYFQASVSLYDEKELIIFFRPDPGPESPFLLQALDPESGAIRWTRKGNFSGTLTRTADGLYLRQGMKLYRISDTETVYEEPERVL